MKLSVQQNIFCLLFCLSSVLVFICDTVIYLCYSACSFACYLRKIGLNVTYDTHMIKRMLNHMVSGAYFNRVLIIQPGLNYNEVIFSKETYKMIVR